MSYSNGLLSDQSYQTANKYVQRGLPGVGFKLTDTGDYDMQNKKLTNVKSGTDSNDAVNKSQLDATTNLLHGSRAGDVVNDKAVIYSNTGAVHANSLYIEDPPDQGNSNEVRIMTEHQSYPNIHLNIPDLHNFDGHGGRPKSELMVTSVEQTVTGKKVFENIEVHDPTSNNQAANKSYADTKLSLTGGTMTGDLILPHHNYPIPGNTNKVINYESQREIFLSRQESFPMQADINMNNNFIQNIATPTSSHQVTNKGYCDYNFLNRQKGGVLMGPLSMNRNDLIEIPDTPKFGHSAVNKKYVDAVNFRSMTATLRGFRIGLNRSFVHLDGSEAMIGNLDMGDHSIQKVGDPVNSDDVATKNYVDAEIGYISTPFLKLDGTRAMTGVLNMNDHKISNLKMPEFNTDAANKQYIDEALSKSHLVSSHIENAFKYLLDQDESSSEKNIIVNGIQDFNGSPHKNKKAYDIDLIYTSETQNYDSKIGINLYPLPVGKFTIIMEYYFPEDINISLLAEASTAIINKQAITNFPSYKKQLVQINQQTKDTPDYLFFTIRGSGTTATNPEGHLVFYGVKEWVDSVRPKIYDHAMETGMFEYKNNSMYMNTSIDLNNNYQIKNLKKGTNSSDGVNKSQLDSVSYYSKGYMYRTIFGGDFYDLIETSRFNLIQGVSGVVINGVLPNFVLETDRFITDYNPKYGLKLSTKTHIRTADIFNQNSSFTFFMSFMHDSTKTGEISFSNTLNLHFKFYPRYRITSNKLIIDYQPGTHETTFTSDFQNKQLFVWICFDGTHNLYKMALSNYSSHVSETFSPPVNFQSRQLEIDYEVYVNKIGFTNRFIDIDDLEFHRITLEEKRNGSYL